MKIQIDLNQATIEELIDFKKKLEKEITDKRKVENVRLLKVTQLSFCTLRELTDYLSLKYGSKYFIPKNAFAIVDDKGIHHILISASPSNAIYNFINNYLRSRSLKCSMIRLLGCASRPDKHERYTWLKALLEQGYKVSSYGFKNYYPSLYKEKYPDLFDVE